MYDDDTTNHLDHHIVLERETARSRDELLHDAYAVMAIEDAHQLIEDELVRSGGIEPP